MYMYIVYMIYSMYYKIRTLNELNSVTVLKLRLVNGLKRNLTLTVFEEEREREGGEGREEDPSSSPN